MKKIINIFVFLIFLVVVIYLFFPQLYIKMVSDTSENLEKAVVTVYKETDRESMNVIKIVKKKKLNKLYEIIENTDKINVKRYPRHSIVEGADPEFEITLFYADGKMDKFATPENPEKVYRILKNNGYIIGENSMLYEYVLKLADGQ
ncbi:MAG: hypothetical protein IKA17_09130 [Clostridia bacterium]|nr:hypothetical protein [Clostridia bacterium]